MFRLDIRYSQDMVNTLCSPGNTFPRRCCNGSSLAYCIVVTGIYHKFEIHWLPSIFLSGTVCILLLLPNQSIFQVHMTCSCDCLWETTTHGHNSHRSNLSCIFVFFPAGHRTQKDAPSCVPTPSESAASAVA